MTWHFPLNLVSGGNLGSSARVDGCETIRDA